MMVEAASAKLDGYMLDTTGWVSDSQVLRNHEIIRKYALCATSLR
jgi:hypothetical protein